MAEPTIPPEVRGMLRDLIEVESQPFKDALNWMLALWLVENSIVPAGDDGLEDPPSVFDTALTIGDLKKGSLPVAVVMGLTALDYQWPGRDALG
jgi:hypothetical protein